VSVDLEAGSALHLCRHVIEAGIVDLGDLAADPADDVVVMGRPAGNVGVLAGRQVDALEHVQLGQQVERPEDRRAADLEPPGARVGEQR
jgi:hypothetical protein